jgi:hypothetical protein
MKEKDLDFDSFDLYLFSKLFKIFKTFNVFSNLFEVSYSLISQTRSSKLKISVVIFLFYYHQIILLIYI